MWGFYSCGCPQIRLRVWVDSGIAFFSHYNSKKKKKQEKEKKLSPNIVQINKNDAMKVFVVFYEHENVLQMDEFFFSTLILKGE